MTIWDIHSNAINFRHCAYFSELSICHDPESTNVLWECRQGHSQLKVIFIFIVSSVLKKDATDLLPAQVKLPYVNWNLDIFRNIVPLEEYTSLYRARDFSIVVRKRSYFKLGYGHHSTKLHRDGVCVGYLFVIGNDRCLWFRRHLMKIYKFRCKYAMVESS